VAAGVAPFVPPDVGVTPPKATAGATHARAPGDQHQRRASSGARVRNRAWRGPGLRLVGQG
jgi:hypothetical protein